MRGDERTEMLTDQSRRYAGEIKLSFVNRGGKTVAEQTYRHGNSRISANIPVAGEIPYYFLISTGGGYTEGEHYLQQVSLGNETHAIVTTQTPNYIYKCEHGKMTSQTNVLKVGDHSVLEYYIDETIPYAHALFEQDTDIELGEDACLILTDGLTDGWSSDESPFQYGQIGILTTVTRKGRLLFNDYLLVDPTEEPMAEIGYFEGAAAFNSAVIIDPGMNESVVKAMREDLSRLSTSSRYGMSLLEDHAGVVLRVLGESAHLNHAVVGRFIAYYREQVKDWAPVDLRKHR